MNVLELLIIFQSVVAHARDKLIPVNCTFRAICGANKMLVDKFGDVGRSVAALIRYFFIARVSKQTDLTFHNY